MTLEFSLQIFKQISWNVRRMGAQMFHAEGQTDKKKWKK